MSDFIFSMIYLFIFNKDIHKKVKLYDASLSITRQFIFVYKYPTTTVTTLPLIRYNIIVIILSQLTPDQHA